MEDTLSFDDLPSIGQLSEQARRERIRNSNHLAGLHPWWARLPTVVARPAVYLALTHESDPDSSFIDQLCACPVESDAVESARQSILQLHGAMVGEEKDQDAAGVSAGSEIISLPRLLDLFSGSGTIPLEAIRLGCQAYSVDLNPVAYLIQLCTVVYPQEFGAPAQTSRGSSDDGTWAGLTTEVQFWSRWIHKRVRAETEDLYSRLIPPEGEVGEAYLPRVYFWAHTVSCSNQSCHAMIPMVQQSWLVKRSGHYVALRPELDYDEMRVRFEIAQAATAEGLGFVPDSIMNRGEAICPFCQSRLSADYVRGEGRSERFEKLLLAVMCEDDNGDIIYASGEALRQGMHELRHVDARARDLEDAIGLSTLKGLLPSGSPFPVSPYGLARYEDLFTDRQLLTMLIYIKHILSAHGQMSTQRFEPDRSKAVMTYLGLLLDNLANWNNTLCSWNPHSRCIVPAFGRPGPPTAWQFAELNPFAQNPSEMPMVDQMIAAIEHCRGLGLPAEVHCVSATHLPFEDDFFDAVVTNPPYYDSVAYADLSGFFYVWLKRSVGHLYPKQFELPLVPTDEEVIVAPQRHNGDRQAATDAYEQMMETALSEAGRVLKPSGLVTLIITATRPDVLQPFLTLAHRAGLELFDARKIELHPTRQGETKHSGFQVLLTFRKSSFALDTSESNVDAETVLDLVESGRPNLYAGLADLLCEHLSQELLDPCIPPEYKGSFYVRLREYIADCEDPGELLEGLVGRPGLIGIAARLGLTQSASEVNPETASQLVLGSLGFSTPEPVQEGVSSAVLRIQELIPRVQLARDVPELRGPFLTGMTLLENVLRQAGLAWSHAVFGAANLVHLKSIVEGKSLQLLSMGDVKRIYCELPDYVARSPSANRAEKLFGYAHPYRPKKYVKCLDKIIALRNKMEHNTDGYLDITSFPDVRDEILDGLELARHTLAGLLSANALPLLVKPVRETTDMYGRQRVELLGEDGVTREVYVTRPIQLGSDYVLLRPQGNPRPVDPPMFLVSEALGANVT